MSYTENQNSGHLAEVTGRESEPLEEGTTDGTAGRAVEHGGAPSSSSSEEPMDSTSNAGFDRKRKRMRVSHEWAEKEDKVTSMLGNRAKGIDVQASTKEFERLVGLTWQDKYTLHKNKMKEAGRWCRSSKRGNPPDIFRFSKWEPIEIERVVGIRRKDLLRREQFDEACKEFHEFYSDPEIKYDFQADWKREERDREKEKLWNLPWAVKYKEHMKRMEALQKWIPGQCQEDGSRPPIFVRSSNDPMEQILSARLQNLLKSDVFDMYCQEFHDFYNKTTGYDFRKDWERNREKKYYSRLSWPEKYSEHLKLVSKDDLGSLDQDQLRAYLFSMSGASPIQRFVSRRFQYLLRSRGKVPSKDIDEFHDMYMENTGFDFKGYLDQQLDIKAQDTDMNASDPSSLVIETPEILEIPPKVEGQAEIHFKFYKLKGLVLWKKQCFDEREKYQDKGILVSDVITTENGQTYNIGKDMQKWSSIARNELDPDSAKMQRWLIETRRQLINLVGIANIQLPDPLWIDLSKNGSATSRKQVDENGYTIAQICQEHKEEILQSTPARWIKSLHRLRPDIFEEENGASESRAAMTLKRLLNSPTFGEQCQGFHQFYWNEVGYDFVTEWEDHRIHILSNSTHWVDKFEAHKMQVMKEDRLSPSQPARWKWSEDGSRPKIFKVTATKLEHEVSRRRDRLMQRMHIDRDVEEFHDFYYANIGYDFKGDWKSNKTKRDIPWIEKYNAHKKVIQMEDFGKPEISRRWKPLAKDKTLPPVFRKDGSTCSREESAVGKRRDTLLRKREWDEACREFHEFYKKELGYDFEQDWHAKKNKADPHEEECAEILCDLKGDETSKAFRIRRNHHHPIKDPEVIDKLRKAGLTELGEKKITVGEVRCRPKLMYKRMFQPPLSERSFPTVVHACIMEDCIKIIVEMLGLVRGHDPVKDFSFGRTGYDQNSSLVTAIKKVVDASLEASKSKKELRPSSIHFWEFVKTSISDHRDIDELLQHTVMGASAINARTKERDFDIMALSKWKTIDDRMKSGAIGKFQANFEKIQDFLQTHSSLPKPRDGDKSLASWLRHQRIQYLNNNLRDEPGVMAGLTGEQKRKMLDSLPGWKEYLADAKFPNGGRIYETEGAIPSKYTKLQANIEKHLEILGRWKRDEEGKSAISRKLIPPQRCIYNDTKYGETRLGSWIYRFKKSARKGIADARKVLVRIGEILELGEGWWEEPYTPTANITETPPMNELWHKPSKEETILENEITVSAASPNQSPSPPPPSLAMTQMHLLPNPQKTLPNESVSAPSASRNQSLSGNSLSDLFTRDVEELSTNDIFQVIQKLAEQFCIHNPERKREIGIAISNIGFRFLKEHEYAKLLYSLAKSCVDSENLEKFFQQLVAQEAQDP